MYRNIMNKRVSPAVAIVAFIVLVIAIFYYGRDTMAEPPSAIGFVTVNGVTREMTRQEAINMGLAMQGKRAIPTGVSKTSRPYSPTSTPPAQ